MERINATDERKKLYPLINAIAETLYLNSIPGLVDSINESDIDELDGLERFDISKEW